MEQVENNLQATNEVGKKRYYIKSYDEMLASTPNEASTPKREWSRTKISVYIILRMYPTHCFCQV